MNSLLNSNSNKLIQYLYNISILYRFSNLDYLLKEIRVIYLKDVEILLPPFISINANEGDMTSVPRWISIILSKQGLIEIHDEDDLSYIKRALNRERSSSGHILSSIDPDFYVRVNNYRRNIDEKERESLIVSLNPFISARRQKIVKISASSPLVPEIEEKLSLEEKLLYEDFYKMTSNFKKILIQRSEEHTS